MDSLSTPRTTLDFAAYGIRSIIRDRAVAHVEGALSALSHDDIISYAEGQGIDGVVSSTLEAAGIIAAGVKEANDKAARLRAEG